MFNLLNIFLTILRGNAEIPKTREVSDSSIREVKDSGQARMTKKLVMESLSCPYCGSIKFQKRGFRQKKLERIQLYLCLSCNKTFTPYSTKGKHYPLSVMLDAISIYNLGYSLEQTCKLIQVRSQKEKVKSTIQNSKIDAGGSEFPLVTEQASFISKVLGGMPLNPFRGRDHTPASTSGDTTSTQDSSATPASIYQSNTESANMSSDKRDKLSEDKKQSLQWDVQPSTLSNWLAETTELCRFSRMREFALKKFSPKEMVIHATLAHRQLYRYRFHQAKCDLMIKEEYQHRKFVPLKEFLEMVPVECPHQYFQEGLRASESPLTFSKKQMIVRAKQNYATKLCTFVLQSVKERKGRHEALQKFMLVNDSVTVATEVPVYITKDDIEHMKTQLGFEIYNKISCQELKSQNSNLKTTTQNFKPHSPHSPAADFDRSSDSVSLPKADAPIAEADIVEIASLPKLITGHIDILQIRNGQIHILDYKPRAEKERPIEQLTLYAMALSRLTGLRLYEFKCAWFDEKDYFEFYPLHVLHKPKKNSRRRKIVTDEGVYKINQDREKILTIRPITNY